MDKKRNIQNAILAKIRIENGLRYRDARPDDEDIENDLYNYHLQMLVN